MINSNNCHRVLQIIIYILLQRYGANLSRYTDWMIYQMLYYSYDIDIMNYCFIIVPNIPTTYAACFNDLYNLIDLLNIYVLNDKEYSSCKLNHWVVSSGFMLVRI